MKEHTRKLLAFAAINQKGPLLALGVILTISLFAPTPVYALWPLIFLGGAVLTQLFDIPILSGIVGAAAKPFLDALAGFFNIIFGLIASIIQGIYIGLAETFYRLITFFMEVPVSPAEAVPFVQEAFDFSRLLVNALFILVLVFIGLATILRLQNYQLQKNPSSFTCCCPPCKLQRGACWLCSRYGKYYYKFLS